MTIGFSFWGQSFQFFSVSFFQMAGNVIGYGFVADKSAGFVRRKPKIVNLRGLSARKVRSNEL